MQNKNQRDLLPDLYKLIIETVEPQKIFCLAQQTCKPGYADLLITVNEMPVNASSEINMAMKIAAFSPNFLAITVSQDACIDKLIGEGNIFLNVACNPDTLVYDQGQWTKPVISNATRGRQKEQAYPVFYSGMQKAHAFSAIARIHQEHNLALAAFLLHQSVELSLHTLMKALSAKENRSHYLQQQLLYSFRYDHQLPLALNNGDEESERLLKLLDDAYDGYRYTNQYHIGQDDLNILLKKTDHLQELCELTFLNWLKRYEAS